MLLTNFGVMDGRELWTDKNSVPTDPGVYAWYRRLSVDDLTPDLFRTTLTERLKSTSLLPTFSGTAGPYGVNLGPGTFELTEAKVSLAK
jgi:hypothetical protein